MHVYVVGGKKSWNIRFYIYCSSIKKNQNPRRLPIIPNNFSYKNCPCYIKILKRQVLSPKMLKLFVWEEPCSTNFSQLTSHLRNPWHNSFLENIVCIVYSFLCMQQQYIFGHVYKKIDKIKTYLFQRHVAHSLHQNAWPQPDSYESWENLL